MNRSALSILLITSLFSVRCNAQSKPLTVEVVATASEYVPPKAPTQRTRRIEGQSLTNCSGNTSYLGDFSHTQIECSTTSTPSSTVTESSPQSEVAAGVAAAVTKRRILYTVVKSDSALYLLSCRERWKWSKCPTFGIGAKYVLTIDKSDVLLRDESGKQTRLENLSSVALPLEPLPAHPEGVQTEPLGEAKVHITSTPSNAEIFIDEKFFGDTPADLTLPAGDHFLKLTVAGKHWSRSIQITSGETNVHAEITTEVKQTSQIDEREQAGMDQLRTVAQQIMDCPRSAEWLDTKGIGTIYDGPPANVIWDAKPSNSIRAPYTGSIEFFLPREFVVPSQKCDKEPSYCADVMSATKPFEYRYEFDLGPGSLTLTKMLVKSESAGFHQWGDARRDDSCWQKAARRE